MRLKHRILNRDGGRLWAVYGTGGVVSWELLKPAMGGEAYGPIILHSLRPLWDGMEAGDDCPFLESTCFTEFAFFAGDKLSHAWAEAGRDDEVIWRELESWYRSRLGDGGPA